MSPSILIIEDHPLFAAGVIDLLRLMCPEANIKHATSLEKGKAIVQSSEPNLILSDVHLPDCNVNDLMKWLYCDVASIPTIMITSDTEFVTNSSLEHRQNLWVISKQADFETTSHTIARAAKASGLTIKWGTDADSIDSTQEDCSKPFYKKELTDKQLLVMDLVSLGLSNKEIAKQLQLSPETVKHHMKQIHDRLGVNSRTQAVAVYKRMSILDNQN